MEQMLEQNKFYAFPKPHQWSLPAKFLATVTVVMMAAGMTGALGQIILHDIIPTFSGEKSHQETPPHSMGEKIEIRGDLFSGALPAKKVKPFYTTDEFIFALKFTHIHIFGMSAIFIVMGLLVAFLSLSIRARIWLITLPFIGVIVDLASVWLKLFVHPAFFWLHLPGGAVFGVVFGIDSIMILRQMWVRK